VVLAFGDSLTYGTGAPRGESYPDLLSESINRQVVNAGRPGEISRDGVARLPELLDTHAPALLILCHGGNDILRKLNSSETKANLERMIEMAQRRGAEVVLIGVPKPGLLLGDADIYPQVAAEYSLPYDGEILADILSDRELKSDTIHPNADGYRRLAEAIHRLLQRSGAI